MSNTHDTAVECSLRACGKAISLASSGRVDVRGTVTKLAKPGASIKWTGGGCASFHTACWEEVEKAAKRRRRSAKPGTGVQGGAPMSAPEARLVRDAASTAEFHDSDAALAAKAKRIADLLRAGKHVVAFTGAGISTSAGIGDYRGLSGKWTDEDRANKASNEGVASPVPSGSRSSGAAGGAGGGAGAGAAEEEEEQEEGVAFEALRPTYTHEALVKLMDMGLLRFIISQNGDGLHILSGVDPSRVAELHGNVFLERCPRCKTKHYRKSYVCDDHASLYYEELEDNGSTDIIKPKHANQCSTCGLSHTTVRQCTNKKCRRVHLQDSIINFGDDLWEEVLNKARDEAKRSDVMLSLGSTMAVTPANSLVKAGKAGSRIIIANRQRTDFDKLCDTRLGWKASRKRGRGSDGGSGGGAEDAGVRVYGDCDRLFRAVMAQLLPAKERKGWEGGREKRLAKYDKERVET